MARKVTKGQTALFYCGVALGNALDRAQENGQYRHLESFLADVLSWGSAKMLQHSTMAYSKYLRTDRWLTIRRLKLEQVGGRCEFCNSDDHINVHHRTYERRGNERLSDLTVLCNGCHRRHHGK